MPVAEIPPPRKNAPPLSDRLTQAVEEMRDNPGKAVLVEELTGITNHRSMFNTIRQGAITELRQMGGVVVPTTRTREVDGETVGDVYLVWMPNEDPRGVYADKYLDRDERLGR